MIVLVTGVKGQLGFDVVNELTRRGQRVIGVDIDKMDITDENAVRNLIMDADPDVVIHCAAYTAVDKAEDDVDMCRKVNAGGTENIAKVCKELDIKMVYFSTDYVFSGEGEKEWKPEDKVTIPLNVYGLTKYEGELAVKKYLDKYFILRISWVFGVNGHNFVKTMLKLGKEQEKVKVVDDQVGSPTYTYDLAMLVCDMIATDKYGVYHVTNEGECSWYEFACEIFKAAGMTDVEVIPVSSDEFKSKAKRPKNSRMSKEKLTANGFDRLPTWQDATRRYVEILMNEK